MLTKKQNLLETIHNGQPDRFVNQYEYINLIFDPIQILSGGNIPPGGSGISGWGVHIIWPEGEPGPFPLHGPQYDVITDITNWRDTVEPNTPDPQSIPDADWEGTYKLLSKIDRNDCFVSPFSANGIFEKLHYFMGMENTMINMYEEPEATHDLIDYITDWMIEVAKETCRRYHPDAIFQHDDWGSQDRLLMSPEMWREFFKEPYKRLYDFWKKECGAQIVIHHSDSYVADLVPDMIDIGIDIHQGTVTENNIPELIKKYGDRISFHGGLDNGKLDKANWKKEDITAALEYLIRETGGKSLIPGFTRGGPGTTYDGAYDWATEEIDRLSKEYFKI